MYPLMGAQVTTLSKALPTCLALKGLFTSVAAHMDLERARPHEALIANVALKGPLTCMASVMVRQVPMRRKRAAAVLERADERLLTVMDALVRLEVTLLCEALTTALELTDEWLLSCMRSHMDFQSSSARVALATDFTIVGLLASVNKLVSLQVSFRDKTLITAWVTAFERTLSGLSKIAKNELSANFRLTLNLHEYEDAS